jgi:hypothetical protein
MKHTLKAGMLKAKQQWQEQVSTELLISLIPLARISNSPVCFNAKAFNIVSALLHPIPNHSVLYRPLKLDV